jgi:hypothetical protein
MVLFFAGFFFLLISPYLWPIFQVLLVLSFPHFMDISLLFWSCCLVAFLLARETFFLWKYWTFIKMGFFNILFKEAAHVRQGFTISNQTKVSSTKTPQLFLSSTKTLQLFLTRNLWTKESKLFERPKVCTTMQIKQNGHTLVLLFVVEEVPSGALLVGNLCYITSCLLYILFWRLGLCVVGVVDIV